MYPIGVGLDRITRPKKRPQAASPVRYNTTASAIQTGSTWSVSPCSRRSRHVRATCRPTAQRTRTASTALTATVAPLFQRRRDIHEAFDSVGKTLGRVERVESPSLDNASRLVSSHLISSREMTDSAYRPARAL